MKIKTLLELVTLSSSLYYFAKDTHIIDKINEMAEKGRNATNKNGSNSQTNEVGDELEFIEKIVQKVSQVKEELDQKIEESVVKFYKKMNVAHLDEIKALNEKIEKLDMTIALLEARLNHMETAK